MFQFTADFRHTQIKQERTMAYVKKKKKKKPNDNRSFERIKKTLDIQIYKKISSDLNDAVLLTGIVTVDMSASGILLRSNSLIEPGTELLIHFLESESLPSFKAESKVIRVDLNHDNQHYDVGVHFTRIDNEMLLKLDDYLTSSSPNNY